MTNTYIRDPRFFWSTGDHECDPKLYSPHAVSFAILHQVKKCQQQFGEKCAMRIVETESYNGERCGYVICIEPINPNASYVMGNPDSGTPKINTFDQWVADLKVRPIHS